jgi:hypothetical protein
MTGRFPSRELMRRGKGKKWIYELPEEEGE